MGGSDKSNDDDATGVDKDRVAPDGTGEGADDVDDESEERFRMDSLLEDIASDPEALTRRIADAVASAREVAEAAAAAAAVEAAAAKTAEKEATKEGRHKVMAGLTNNLKRCRVL